MSPELISSFMVKLCETISLHYQYHHKEKTDKCSLHVQKSVDFSRLFCVQRMAPRCAKVLTFSISAEDHSIPLEKV